MATNQDALIELDAQTQANHDQLMLAQLAKELRVLQQAKKDIDEQITVTKAGILDIIQETTQAGDEKLIVTRPKKVDYHAIQRDFNADNYPQLYEHKISTAAVKKAFSPDVLDQYAQISDPQVKLA